MILRNVIVKVTISQFNLIQLILVGYILIIGEYIIRSSNKSTLVYTDDINISFDYIYILKDLSKISFEDQRYNLYKLSHIKMRPY